MSITPSYSKLLSTFVVAMLGAAGELRAEEAREAVTTQPEAIEAVVRGFYVEARLGGGYAVIDQKLEPLPPQYPTLSGSEQLGPGSLLQLALGIDVTSFLALQLVGGSALISSSRPDRVRDVALHYAGLVVRGAYNYSQRLQLTADVGGIYVSAENGIEAPQRGAGAAVGLGVEYYVHVRHFSVGAQLMGLAASAPQRLFIALTPHLKYTF